MTIEKLKIYFVGGCVRDELLGLKPKDIDYVVIDSNEEKMVQLGFKKVGNSFPVFLDNKGDEYALARTEKSTGNAYTDFECVTKNVSLEDDLMRRDLTINSIARDKNGNYFDPFDGIKDLKNKILKHTSNSFVEDPVRILRIFRFNSRLSDFSIDNKTKILIKDMLEKNMLDNIKYERIFKEINKVLEEKKPIIFFKLLKEFNIDKKVLGIKLNETHLKNIEKISNTNFKNKNKLYIYSLYNTKENNINLKEKFNFNKKELNFNNKVIEFYNTDFNKTKNLIKIFDSLKLEKNQYDKLELFFDLNTINSDINKNFDIDIFFKSFSLYNSISAKEISEVIKDFKDIKKYLNIERTEIIDKFVQNKIKPKIILYNNVEF